MRRLSPRLTRALAIVVLPGTLAFGKSAAAQDTSDLEGLLDTSVVSAPSKTPEAVSVAPSTSLVLTADDLRRYGIRNMEEAINYLAFGMMVERDFQASEIGARGVHFTSDFGSHVLLMVDGHVLNEQWGATAYFDRATGIPFELIDHIEIVLGPGSVLYGSNAMLGIVHIVTKRAKDFSGVRVAVESELPISIRGMAGAGKEFELFGSNAELTVALEHYEHRGPTFDFRPIEVGADAITEEPRDLDVDPKDRRYPPGVWGGKGDDALYTRAPSGYLRFRVGDVELGLRGALNKRAYPTNTGNFDDPDSYEIDRWLHLDLKHTARFSAGVQLSTRLYADHYDYHQYWTSNGAEDCLEGQDSGCLWTLHGQARTVGLEPQLSFDWFEDGRATTLLGVDGRLKVIESSTDFSDNVLKDTNEVGVYSPTEKALAAYAQQTWAPSSWLALNGGARIDVDDRFGSHVSPRAALALMPWQGGTIKGMYSEAFRAPTAFDIYYNDPATQIPGGKNLEPETVRSVEGSIEERFGAQTLQVAVFRSWWEDILLLQDLTPEEVEAANESGSLLYDFGYQVRNVSKIDSYGVNLAYEGSLMRGRFRYGASVTQAIARRQEPDGSTDLLAVAPHAHGNARVSYDLGGGLPTVAVAGRWVSRRPLNDYPDTGFAAPFWETRITLSGALPPLPALSYRLSWNYVGTKYGAYVQRRNAELGLQELNPFDRSRFAAGLQYEF